MFIALSLIAVTAFRSLGIVLEIAGLVILGIALGQALSNSPTRTDAKGTIAAGIAIVVVGLLLAVLK